MHFPNLFGGMKLRVNRSSEPVDCFRAVVFVLYARLPVLSAYLFCTGNLVEAVCFVSVWLVGEFSCGLTPYEKYWKDLSYLLGFLERLDNQATGVM